VYILDSVWNIRTIPLVILHVLSYTGDDNVDVAMVMMMMITWNDNVHEPGLTIFLIDEVTGTRCRCK
jgi:hypoxanthine phosphoribosyltransferase